MRGLKHSWSRTILLYCSVKRQLKVTIRQPKSELHSVAKETIRTAVLAKKVNGFAELYKDLPPLGKDIG